MPLGPPGGPVFYDPVEQGLFKADVMAGLLALDPFMAKDLFALGEKFLVEQGLADEFGRFVNRRAHGCKHNFRKIYRASIVLEANYVNAVHRRHGLMN